MVQTIFSKQFFRIYSSDACKKRKGVLLKIASKPYGSLANDFFEFVSFRIASKP